MVFNLMAGIKPLLSTYQGMQTALLEHKALGEANKQLKIFLHEKGRLSSILAVETNFNTFLGVPV